MAINTELASDLSATVLWRRHHHGAIIMMKRVNLSIVSRVLITDDGALQMISAAENRGGPIVGFSGQKVSFSESSLPGAGLGTNNCPH